MSKEGEIHINVMMKACTANHHPITLSFRLKGSNGRDPAERKVRITSAPPAKRAAGAVGKCLASQQPIEPGGALEEESEAAKKQDAWCFATLRKLQEESPLSLKVSLRSVSSFIFSLPLLLQPSRAL
ncbi:hypothetical protein RND71_007422 [Anisodus tanguticus]|uniref:Uncharacterized protein n=1 Tax=Anisodus tanguticus TaxID=243964 RepID=A0AAE1VJ47_9SOLA|nr:hypothetical protein RND71_007422 [Anisodus tanguticus]